MPHAAASRGANLLHVQEELLVEPGGLVLATDVRWAEGLVGRLRGLRAGRPTANQALVFSCAPQVHTWGMAAPIDVVFCDRSWRVKRVIGGLPPRRLSPVVLGARYTIEMAEGAAGNVEAGDQIVLKRR